MSDALTIAIERIVASQVREALGPHLATLQQLATFLGASRSTRGGVLRGRGRRASTGGGKAACAVIGCGLPARSRGYCVNHYQKFHKLKKSNRLPGDWGDPGKPQSAKDIILPRGRAAAKARKAR